MYGMRRSRLQKTFEAVFESEDIKYEQIKQLKKQMKTKGISREVYSQLKKKLEDVQNGPEDIAQQVRARLFQKISNDKL